MTFSKLCLLTKLTKLGLFNLKCMLKTNKDSNFSMDAFFFASHIILRKYKLLSQRTTFFFFGDNLCGGGMEILQKQKPPTPTHILSLLLENC